MPDLEMLPCPFCGEEARHSTHQDESLWSHNTVPWHTIGCPRCEIEMRQCDGFDDILVCWNSRPRVAEFEEVLSELADLMDDVVEGNYTPDSFTSQPARTLLANR